MLNCPRADIVVIIDANPAAIHAVIKGVRLTLLFMMFSSVESLVAFIYCNWWREIKDCAGPWQEKSFSFQRACAGSHKSFWRSFESPNSQLRARQKIGAPIIRSSSREHRRFSIGFIPATPSAALGSGPDWKGPALRKAADPAW